MSSAEKPRVLHVHSGNLYGGIEVLLRTLGQHAGPDLPVAMEFALCFDDRLARELREAGQVVHVLGATRVRSPRSVHAARKRLSQVIEGGRFDVAVCHSAWPHALFSPVVRAHGLRLAHYMHDAPNPRGWLDRWASRTPPDLVLGNSTFTESRGMWQFPGVPRRMVRYPVVLAAGGDRDERRKVRASLETSDAAVVILLASRMQAWKGHELLVAALGQLRADPRWVCWIAGGAQRDFEVAYEKGLRAEAARLGIDGRVRFLGQRSDVPALLRSADIHCQPNAGPEPFGIVFVEALAAGLPVVTTAMGGPLEFIDASCGVLVPPGDASAVAAALSALVDSPERRRALGKAGPARALALCDATARTRDLATELASLSRREGPMDAHARASWSEGKSNGAIHAAAAAAIREKLRDDGARSDVLVDLGCGRGDCSETFAGLYRTYVGCDLVRYDGFPSRAGVDFREVDLNRVPFPLADASAAAVVSLETIEHVENPRAFVREMARVVRPGGWILVTTPNQVSMASKLTLLTRDQFQAFQQAPGLYPAHITALLPEDLRRIASECGLVDAEIRYTDAGRIPMSSRVWPAALGARGRWFSDNVILVARRP